MPTADPDSDAWNDRARAALARYDEPLLRLVAAKLLKPRGTQPVEELVEKAVATLANAPVIDRRVRDQPPAARKLLALIGLSRQPRWKVGHLISLLAALGHAEGFAPIQTLLENGLLFPEVADNAPPVADFAAWLGGAGTLSATVFAHPPVAARARGEDLELPDLGEPAAGPPRAADGLEWPLRVAAAWQVVQAGAVRLTQGNTVFKRDLGRLEADGPLNAPVTDAGATIPDPAVLALFWAAAAGLLREADGELRPGPFPAAWAGGTAAAVSTLFAALPRVEAWDALKGYAPDPEGLAPAPTAWFLALLLARSPGGKWVTPAAVADWVWTHHPSWAGTISPEAAKTRGAGWVENFLLGVALPLRLVETTAGEAGPLVRLTDLGRHLLAGDPEPSAAPPFPQTLLVQPNAEVLVYRQGLTPELVGSLSRFARWKGVGPACTLELNPEQTYRGLESGLTLAGITQTLSRHGMRPVPAGVADLLRRWADKRERITVFGSATLVEFATPADLDAAVSRGIVSVKLTDRIGMTADGKEPGFAHLRLVANRDYESKPQRCVAVAEDGVTLTVDTAHADLLLDAEIGRFADPLPDPAGARRFRLSPASLRRAAEGGLSAGEVDGWFQDRTGAPLSAAGRLFLVGPSLPPPAAATKLVVTFATAEQADGVQQWPATRGLVAERLGPTALAVAADDLDAFAAALAGVGVRVTGA